MIGTLLWYSGPGMAAAVTAGGILVGAVVLLGNMLRGKP